MSDELLICPGCGVGTYCCQCPDDEQPISPPGEPWRGVPLGVLADLADDAGFDPSDCC